MTFNPEQKAALSAPLHSSHVSSRNQAGRSLSYIEGWHAIAEANRIFGFDAWDRETIETRLVSEKPRKIGQQQKDGWSVSYIAKVRVTVDGRVREGVGAGHGIDVDLGLAHESAIKESETDAMKRALMTFGNPFGLALYDKTQANVSDEPIAATEKAEDAPKPPTVAELKDSYSKLKAELLTEQEHGWKNMRAWLNDTAVLADIEALGRYAEDFKTEAREIFDLAKKSEEEFQETLPITDRTDYQPPDFDGLTP